MAVRLYSHRPALDGMRGYLMVAFLLGHVGVLPFLPGLWIAMNLFFVLSAFLITRLLLAEHRTYGDISVREFYGRRVRRLAPALLITLTAVTLDGLFFAPVAEKINLRGDIFASLLYVMNWRLIARHDPYFEDFTHPSITRHIWSLSVEEQFYLVVAVLIVIVVARLRTRASRTWPFVALALASAAWATTIDLDTMGGQAHAYYGTDVRLQALALGVALGVWTAHRSSSARLLRGKDTDWMDSGSSWPQVLGWAGMLALFVGFALVQPLDGWMYSRGGMLLFCVASAAYIVGCAQRTPTALVRVHSLRPLVYAGKISYGVYVYHWPIYLWLRRYVPELDEWVLAGATLLLAFCAGALSYRFVEQPIMRRGWQAFAPRPGRMQTAVAAVLAFVLGGSLAIGGASAQPGEDAPKYVLRIPELVDGQPRYEQPHPTQHIALYGDSVPYYLTQRMPTKNFPGLDVTNLATPGCDLLADPIQWTPSQEEKSLPQCAAARATYAERFEKSGASTFVMMPGLFLTLRRNVNGTPMWIGDDAYVDHLEAGLTQIDENVRKAGARNVVLTTIPCRAFTELLIPPQYRAAFGASPEVVAEAQNPTRTNAVLRRWAAGHGVKVVDIASPICHGGYTTSIKNHELYDDGVHFSPEATPMIWGWFAPQILKAIGAR